VTIATKAVKIVVAVNGQWTPHNDYKELTCEINNSQSLSEHPLASVRTVQA